MTSQVVARFRRLRAIMPRAFGCDHSMSGVAERNATKCAMPLVFGSECHHNHQ
jgi:hypothetical protein